MIVSKDDSTECDNNIRCMMKVSYDDSIGCVIMIVNFASVFVLERLVTLEKKLIPIL